MIAIEQKKKYGAIETYVSFSTLNRIRHFKIKGLLESGIETMQNRLQADKDTLLIEMGGYVFRELGKEGKNHHVRIEGEEKEILDRMSKELNLYTKHISMYAIHLGLNKNGR
ncbi:hypothetical protein [Alkaliphilus sp. B6464]|uniref:hypothetical protein n=1 Tax=Alkaliphilus sp. B6464 TaxID=2731219 RepID=UPI001BAA0E5C|nr:hypothetical protein [Alkaliphilus sp. B6464]QUH21887.1 hypothetical protein HYG84_18295 [Alkaliphilus sp. B6464]